MNYFGLFVIPDLEKVRIDTKIKSVLYHVYNHAELKGHIKKKFDPDLEVNFQGDHESFMRRSHDPTVQPTGRSNSCVV